MLFRCLSNDGVELLLDIPVHRKPEALSPVLNAGRCGEVAVYGQGRACRPSHTLGRQMQEPLLGCAVIPASNLEPFWGPEMDTRDMMIFSGLLTCAA